MEYSHDLVTPPLLWAAKTPPENHDRTVVAASNVFNHRNYETPDMNVDDGPTGFGIITALQTAEGAGPRNIEITARISF